MRHNLYLAWRSLWFHKGKSGVLLAVMVLVSALPLALHLFLQASERQFLSRAEATPLLLGHQGSALDLVLHALYFTPQVTTTVAMAAAQSVSDSGLATAIPLYIRFRARGYPIVGTSLDYFAFRQLRLQAGRPLALLGECVLGATVARELNLHPGQTLASTPENLFDLAGSVALQMQVVGVLDKRHTPDDTAVFVDLKTAWILAGLGHGHQDLHKSPEASLLLEQQATHVVANAQLMTDTAVTAQNLDTFHFHGDMADFPLTAIIAVPADRKAATLLLGRYRASSGTLQLLQPTQIIRTLVHHIFQIKQLFDAVFVLVGVTMLLAIALIVTLSLQLRQQERQTIHRLGAQRHKMLACMTAEMGILFLISVTLATGLVLGTTPWHTTVMQQLLW